MKILIISTKYTGMGHHSISNAIISQLEKEKIDYKVLEIFDYVRPIVKNMASNYGYIVENKPNTWKFWYNYADKHHLMQAWFYQWGLRRKFKNIVNEYNPDIVVSVHPNYVHSLITYRKKYHLNYQFVTVVADLITINTCFIDERSDLTIFPTQKGVEFCSKSKYLKFDKVKYKVNILPVRRDIAEFAKNLTFESFKPKTEDEIFNVLMASGGSGSTNFEAFIDKLLSFKNIRLNILCGRNEERKAHLIEKYGDTPKINCLGFVEDMTHLLEQQDVAILRASPNTILECVAMCIPILLYSAVYGQEEGNIDYVVDNGLGFFCSTPDEIAEHVGLLRNDSETLLKIKKRDLEVRELDSVVSLVDLIKGVVK